ncbi:MAG: hypothetical protein ACM3W4_11745 [Ignavibacteriales bacterium]
MADYYLARMIEKCLVGEGAREAARELCANMAVALRGSPVTARWPEAMGMLLQYQPMPALDAFLLASEEFRRPRLLQSDSRRDPLAMPAAVLMEWAELDPETRLPILAASAPLFAVDGTPAPILLALLERVPGHEDILCAMSRNLSPAGGMLEDLVATCERRSEGMRSLFGHSNPTVAAWACRAAATLAEQANSWRSHRRERDEAFE